jgi:ribosomal protein L39E
MLWNIAYKKKHMKKSSNMAKASKPKNRVCACIIVKTDEDEESRN